VTDFLVSIANIFIDDIVTWQEDIRLGVTGGAGLHALSGCRVWNEHLGIVASVGEDVRPFLPEMNAMGIDTSGIIYEQTKTNRAWQVFQPGDLRVEVLRDPSVPISQAIPDFQKLPASYREAAGYHILWNDTNKPLLLVLQEIRQLNPDCAIVLEPSPADCFKPPAFFKEIFPYIDGFSPSQSEGQSILKIDSPQEIVREFLRLGCRSVALRMGELGSLAGVRSGKLYRIPATEAEIVDVTGAGNAYAGGWLCGLAQHQPVLEALAMASVSASFEIEQYGLCRFNDDKKSIRDARFARVLQQIREE
jgi:sugar/nucleoside kinase (ribokinase family)